MFKSLYKLNIEKKPTSPTIKKLCDKCNEPHKNRVVNRCNECRSHMCDKCEEYKSSTKYKTCYACYIENPTCNSYNFEIKKIRDERERISNLKYCKSINCEISVSIKYEYCFYCFKKNCVEYQKPQKINDDICFMKQI